MSHTELQFPDDAPDREIGAALRTLLSPDTGASWPGVESRVMARIADERNSPWSVLAGWTRPAAIAAALIVTAATLLLTRLNEASAAVAYNAVTEEQYPVIEASATSSNEPEATVRMLLER